MRRIVMLTAAAILMASCDMAAGTPTTEFMTAAPTADPTTPTPRTVPASGVRGEVWFEGGRAPGTPHLSGGTVVVRSGKLEVAVIDVPESGRFEIVLDPGPFRLTLESCQKPGGAPHVDIRVPEGGFVDAKLVCSAR